MEDDQTAQYFLLESGYYNLDYKLFHVIILPSMTRAYLWQLFIQNCCCRNEKAGVSTGLTERNENSHSEGTKHYHLLMQMLLKS